MLRTIYLLCLILALVVLMGTVVGITVVLDPVDENSGNGGKFAFFLSGILGMFCIVLLTVLGLIGASVAYVYKDKLPPGRLYKYWWPTLLAAPGVIFMFVLAGKVIVNGF